MNGSKVNSEETRDVLELVSNSSLIDFLNDEENCENVDENQLFSEINRLATLSNNKYESEDEDRTIEELLKEAETLINQPICVEEHQVPGNVSISCESTPLEIRHNLLDRYDYSTVMSTTSQHDDDTSERTILNDQLDSCFDSNPSSSDDDEELSMKSKKSSKSPSTSVKKKKKSRTKSSEIDLTENDVTEKLPSEEFEEFEKILCDKSTAPSPTHSIHSMISSASWLRERELETSNENLNESLKDAEERYNSLRIQYDSLSQVHRVLRDNHLQLQEENEKLKIDLQIINECTNNLRLDLKNMRQDLDSANEISRILQQEIDENRVDRKKFQDISERDAKTIQDLQRQCKEMERILMRKHPDSVSALIVASKNSNNAPEFSASTRRVLEERIAQLEKDAKDQDKKAQDLLTNVQSRFKTVQSKYENHIQDLETQVLSLQQINLEHSKELHARSQKSSETIATQTIDVPEKETTEKRSIASQTISPPSRSNSAQSVANKKSKIPTSSSETSIANKEDAHLMATIRGMRVELAIKEKAVQRLTRELDECKKTMKKLQKERDAYLAKDKSPNSTTAVAPVTPKKVYNPSHYQESGNDSPALKEAMSKIKHLENDFKTLYDKRVKDLKTLQHAHERELTSSHETIRILQNRLEEQVSMVTGGNQVKEKRRGPIDFYALKAKVASLERRHSEREKSLHLLIDALSKGKVTNLSTTDDSTSPTCSSPVNKNL